MIFVAPRGLHNILWQTVPVIVQQVVGGFLLRLPDDDMYIAVSESARDAPPARAPGPPPSPRTEVFDKYVQQGRRMLDFCHDDGASRASSCRSVSPWAVLSSPSVCFTSCWCGS